MRMGQHMKAALDFALRNPGWHSFATDRTTKEAVTKLAARGLVEVIWYGKKSLPHFRATPPMMGV